MVTPNYELARSLAEKKDKLGFSPIVQHLFGMDSRIRIYDFADEIYESPLKAYFIENEHIYIPCVLPAAEHEIAHMVEMKNPKRWTLPDWGMEFHTKFTDDAGKRLFFAALTRETRVRAIQRHLTKSEWSPITEHIAWGGASIETRLPFGRFSTFKDVEMWSMDVHAKTYNAWSVDRIEHEWKIRLAHIQNFMETKVAA